MNQRNFLKSKVSLYSFFIIFALFSSLFILPNTVNAVTREQLDVEFLNDFVLEPSKNEVILDAGDTVSKRISLTNRTERPVDFQIEIEDITGSDNPDDQVKLLGNEKGPYSLKDFLVPEVKYFRLNPGEKITIPIDVSLPSNIAPGGYYGAIIISADDRETKENESDGGVAKIITRVGSIFLVRVNGETIESSHISTFKAIGPVSGLYSSHPEGFEVAIKNEGNVHLVHYGEITVKNLLGKSVASLPIDAFFSLPKATRFKEALWPKSFSIGYYTANLKIYKGYGGDENFDSEKISFFILPWQIVLPIIIVITILIILINLFKKNFKVTKKNKNKK